MLSHVLVYPSNNKNKANLYTRRCSFNQTNVSLVVL